MEQLGETEEHGEEQGGVFRLLEPAAEPAQPLLPSPPSPHCSLLRHLRFRSNPEEAAAAEQLSKAAAPSAERGAAESMLHERLVGDRHR